MSEEYRVKCDSCGVEKSFNRKNYPHMFIRDGNSIAPFVGWIHVESWHGELGQVPKHLDFCSDDCMVKSTVTIHDASKPSIL